MKTIVAIFLMFFLLDCNSAPSTDPVIASLAWVGCNRRGSDWKPTDGEASGANLPQLQQTFADLAIITYPTQVKPFFFFLGDLVPGMSTTQAVGTQLDAWMNLFQAANLSNYNFVPVTGNHEMLTKNGKNQVFLDGADTVWLNWITSNKFDAYAGNGPTNAAPNLDKLLDDQSKFSYSFNSGSIHYVVLNTDTLNSTTKIGWVPLNWLTADLVAAQNNPSITTVLVLGHKPLLQAPPPLGEDKLKGEDMTLDPSLVGPLAELFDNSNKVKAYLCAHGHLWDSQQLPGKRGVWQIISGFGGSPLDYKDHPISGPYFGFTVMNIYESGRIGVTVYRRPKPTPYTAPTVPAVADPEFFIQEGYAGL